MVFAQHGLAGATSAALAAACDVSQALLFRLFRDKRSLYEAVLRHAAAMEPGSFPTEAAAARDDRDVFRGLAEAALVRGESQPALLSLVVRARLDGDAPTSASGPVRSTEARLASYIRARIRERRFRRVDAALTAGAYLGMIEMVAIGRARLATPAAPTVAKVAAELAEILVRGLQR